MDVTSSNQEADAEFDPDRCAALHNELLTKAVSHIPDFAQNVRQNCIQIALQHAPEWADTEALKKEDIARFFSQLNVYPSPNAPFTGEFKQPDAIAFWNPTYGVFCDPDIILLYPTAFDVQKDAGLYLDLFTKRVTWGNIEYQGLPPSDSEAWVPLEIALKKSLEMWHREKYYWEDDKKESILMRAFTLGDLDETLSAWTRLLEAIQSKLGESSEDTHHDPLPLSLVNEYKLSPFAKAFLTKAKRPSFKFIAPGLTTFTDERFEAVMNSELPASGRQKHIKNIESEEDFYPSLILPLADESSTLQRPFYPHNHYLEWLTISFLPGLYTSGVDDRFADTIRLVTAEGSDGDISHTGQRPWGVERELRFVELFDLWTGCVFDGIWEIGADGVSTPHSWFTDPRTKMNREL